MNRRSLMTKTKLGTSAVAGGMSVFVFFASMILFAISVPVFLIVFGVSIFETVSQDEGIKLFSNLGSTLWTMLQYWGGLIVAWIVSGVILYSIGYWNS